MAPIFIVSVLFILAIVSTPCLCKECTSNAISNCFFYNNNGCVFSRKQVKCMEEIDTSTCSDRLLQEYTSFISRARKDAEECPGLPDGICLFNAIRPCDKEVPYKLVFNDDLTEYQIKMLCQEFRGKEYETRTCFQAIKPKCKADHALRLVDLQVKYLDDIQKKCARYK